MIKKITFLISAALLLIINTSIAFGYTLAIPFGKTISVNSPAEYIKAIFTFSLGAGALLAIVIVVIGGIRYTASEAVGNKQDALDQIKKALLGLALLLSAVLILQLINPELPKLNNPDTSNLPDPLPIPPGTNQGSSGQDIAPQNAQIKPVDGKLEVTWEYSGNSDVRSYRVDALVYDLETKKSGGWDTGIQTIPTEGGVIGTEYKHIGPLLPYPGKAYVYRIVPIIPGYNENDLLEQSKLVGYAVEKLPDGTVKQREIEEREKEEFNKNFPATGLGE